MAGIFDSLTTLSQNAIANLQKLPGSLSQKAESAVESAGTNILQKVESATGIDSIGQTAAKFEQDFRKAGQVAEEVVAIGLAAQVVAAAAAVGIFYVQARAVNSRSRRSVVYRYRRPKSRGRKSSRRRR